MSDQQQAVSDHTQPIVRKEVTYNFRAPTEKAIKEAEANKTPIPIKRKPVVIAVPQLTIAGIIGILRSTNDKAKSLLLDSVNSVYVNFVQEKLNELPRHEEINVSSLDLSDVDWDKIAEIPADERKARGIPEELWKAFAENYKGIMPALTGRPLERIENHVKFFLTKFNTCKGNKKLVEELGKLLDKWAENTEELEQFLPIYNSLSTKVTNILNASDEAAAENLL